MKKKEKGWYNMDEDYRIKPTGIFFQGFDVLDLVGFGFKINQEISGLIF